MRREGLERGPDLMVAVPDQVQFGDGFLAMLVKTADERDGHPGKDQTEEHFDGEAVFGAVEILEQEAVDSFSHAEGSEQHGNAHQIYGQKVEGFEG